MLSLEIVTSLWCKLRESKIEEKILSIKNILSAVVFRQISTDCGAFMTKRMVGNRFFSQRPAITRKY